MGEGGEGGGEGRGGERDKWFNNLKLPRERGKFKLWLSNFLINKS